MNWFHIFTLVFIIMKVGGAIDWSWWLVLAPSIFSFTISTVVFLTGVVIAWVTLK